MLMMLWSRAVLRQNAGPLMLIVLWSGVQAILRHPDALVRAADAQDTLVRAVLRPNAGHDALVREADAQDADPHAAWGCPCTLFFFFDF